MDHIRLSVYDLSIVFFYINHKFTTRVHYFFSYHIILLIKGPRKPKYQCPFFAKVETEEHLQLLTLTEEREGEPNDKREYGRRVRGFCHDGAVSSSDR